MPPIKPCKDYSETALPSSVVSVCLFYAFSAINVCGDVCYSLLFKAFRNSYSFQIHPQREIHLHNFLCVASGQFPQC